MLFRYSLGLTLMFTTYFIIAGKILKPLARRHARPNLCYSLASDLILYGPCQLILWLLIRPLPPTKARLLSWSPVHYLIILAAVFFSIPILILSTVLEARLRRQSLAALAEAHSEPLHSAFDIFNLLVIVPFMEELFSRQFLYTRLAAASPMLFIFFSALCFALCHSITGRLALVLSTFWQGLLYALLFAATGSLLLPTLYHALANLGLFILPTCLEKAGQIKRARFLQSGLVLIGLCGFIIFLLNLNTLLPPAIRAQSGAAWQAILSNPGTWILLAAGLSAYVYKGLRLRQQAAPKQA